MNIFVLDENPAIAASYHCDQHLHKMILESAQMLSSNFSIWQPSKCGLVYKPAYLNHPCTRWAFNKANAHWVLTLALELENIRDSLNCPRHSSLEVLQVIADYLEGDPEPHTEFVFAGPPTIGINSTLSITEKYQKYYRQKHRAWLDTGRPMSYKNRPIPPFMADLIT